jgi:branched-chain amino acid transport system substrate-binding protein
MKKISYIIGFVVLVVVIIFMSNHGSGVSDQTQITIGAPLSLTGIATEDGQSIMRGIELAREDLLSRGIKVRVIYEDDSTDSKRTISAVNKLILVDKVQAIIGPAWGFLLDSAASIIDKNQVVSYSPANTSEFVAARSPYIFFGGVKNSHMLAPTVKWLGQVKSKRVAIIVDKSGWGDSILSMFSDATKNVGAEVVLIEEIPFGAEKDSMSVILAKIQSLNVDTILWTEHEEATAIVLKKIQDLKLKINFLTANTVAERLSKNGTIFINPNDQMYFLKTVASGQFSEKFYKKYGEYPGSYSDSAYDGLMIIVEAIRNKKEGQTAADYLKNDTNYKGFQTNYQFDESGDIKGGEWVVEKLK